MRLRQWLALVTCLFTWIMILLFSPAGLKEAYIGLFFSILPHNHPLSLVWLRVCDWPKGTQKTSKAELGFWFGPPSRVANPQVRVGSLHYLRLLSPTSQSVIPNSAQDVVTHHTEGKMIDVDG